MFDRSVEPLASPYVALLAITVAHSHNIEIEGAAPGVKLDAKQVLEDVVVAALTHQGLHAVNVGRTARANNDFRKTVLTAGQAVHLQPMPTTAISGVHANEEGVDALGHLAWGDDRAGKWTFIGQVTCGKSDSWDDKMGEPKGPSWKAYLNTGVEPVAFLAVPHHVEAMHLTKLVQDNERIVLDRLRLTRFLPTVTSDEQKIIETVLGTRVKRFSEPEVP